MAVPLAAPRRAYRSSTGAAIKRGFFYTVRQKSGPTLKFERLRRFLFLIFFISKSKNTLGVFLC